MTWIVPRSTWKKRGKRSKSWDLWMQESSEIVLTTRWNKWKLQRRLIQLLRLKKLHKWNKCSCRSDAILLWKINKSWENTFRTKNVRSLTSSLYNTQKIRAPFRGQHLLAAWVDLHLVQRKVLGQKLAKDFSLTDCLWDEWLVIFKMFAKIIHVHKH